MARAGLYVRPAAGQSGEFDVQTEESRLGVRPGLVVVDHIAGPFISTARFSYLDQLALNDESPDVSIDKADVHRRLLKAQESPSFVGLLTQIIISTIAADDKDLSRTVSDGYDAIRMVSSKEGPTDLLFRNAGVHLVRRREELIYRVKLPSIGLRLAHDRRLMQGQAGHLKSATESNSLIFASSGGLNNGVYVMDAYLGPLLGAITPFIWGFPAARPLGAVIYTLGCPINGASSDSSEPLQMLSAQGADRSTSAPPVSSRAATEAIDWWVSRLDRIFAVMSNPAVFTDAERRYHPAKHMRALMSIEQVFRRVHSIQAAHRDRNARRVLLFTVLDTLKGLMNHDLSTYCRPSFARRTLHRLQHDIPPPASELLLPAAERAVVALEEVANGFFLGREFGPDSVVLYLANGAEQAIKTDNAVASYLEVLRNATHGYGTNRPAEAKKVDALLAQHDGQLSHDLALLAYLYLLDLLNRTEILQTVLFSRGKV